MPRKWSSPSKCGLCIIISIYAVILEAKELPLCPTNIQFFPQGLPMHCRLQLPQMAPISISTEKPSNIPASIALPIPGPMSPFGVPPGIFPGPFPAPFPAPIPGSMPLPIGPPGPKLPVIVMPFYSPEANVGKKKKRPTNTDTSTDTDSISSFERHTDIDTDTDTDTSSDDGWWSGRRKNLRGRRRKMSRRMFRRIPKRKHNKRRKSLITPILQYVTKDGYVVYEKKISKPEAKQWLDINKNRKQTPSLPTNTEHKEIDEDVDGESPENVEDNDESEPETLKQNPKVTKDEVSLRKKVAADQLKKEKIKEYKRKRSKH